jgi:hypothetical protein
MMAGSEQSKSWDTLGERDITLYHISSNIGSITECKHSALRHIVFQIMMRIKVEELLVKTSQRNSQNRHGVLTENLFRIDYI